MFFHIEVLTTLAMVYGMKKRRRKSICLVWYLHKKKCTEKSHGDRHGEEKVGPDNDALIEIFVLDEIAIVLQTDNN